MRRTLTGTLVLLFLVETSATRCDEATTAQVAEGNFGQSGVFNWLGVLKVQSYDNKKVTTALTGIVLVTAKHVLANADDVVRIPRHLFESNTKAMFMPAKGVEWTAPAKSYSTHPEYEYTTVNTIAIVELDVEDVTDFPLNPICLPSPSSSAPHQSSKFLYLTGFTDENRVLQKVIYKIQYLDESVCDEFYNRVGLPTRNSQPTSYVCGYATRNGSTHCAWDNGMALVSNASEGIFYLLGFGVRGPGCAAPARFIDVFPFLPWIAATTTEPEEMYDAPDYGHSVDQLEPI
ncbi:clotting factor B isoform X2 [Spodoptera frugiperda]|uniref:Clotting factor B isoform X2 n=1 Tax=Spodoptera frugiperda TaxID=7108 RepID=A0A9R0DX19_SPOFR|nr:clotting factor B isoform X2 [Spodoptera frugiperda]